MFPKTKHFSFARALMILPAVVLAILLQFSTVFAQDNAIKVSVPANPIEDFVNLDESMNVDVGLQNPNNHAVYYKAELSPALGRCSSGLETSEGIIFEGQSMALNGTLEARCFEQAGNYDLNLRITRVSGPNDPNYVGSESHDIAIKMHVQSSLQNPGWSSRFTVQPVGDLLPNQGFTQTLSVRNNFPVTGTKAFSVEVTNFHYATDGSNFPQVTTGTVHVNADQQKIVLLWTGELSSGEVATMTISSAASPFVGDYRGAFMAKFDYNDAEFNYTPVLLVRGINVIEQPLDVTVFMPLINR